jgi:hypothetical protein
LIAASRNGDDVRARGQLCEDFTRGLAVRDETNSTIQRKTLRTI